MFCTKIENVIIDLSIYLPILNLFEENSIALFRCLSVYAIYVFFNPMTNHIVIFLKIIYAIIELNPEEDE